MDESKSMELIHHKQLARFRAATEIFIHLSNQEGAEPLGDTIDTSSGIAKWLWDNVSKDIDREVLNG